MRLDRLHLKNFRRFEKLTLDLDPSFTLLVGENASGKTSLLDAAAVAVGAFLLGITEARDARPLSAGEVRFVRFRQNGSVFEEFQWPARIEAVGELAGETVEWARALNGPRAKTTRREAAKLAAMARNLADGVRTGGVDALPVFAYYGTQRLWLELRAVESKRGIGSRFDGYIDCMKPASSHRQLTEWLYQQTLIELQEQSAVVAKDAVESAVCQAIAGISRFYFDVRAQEILLQWQDGRIEPFAALSDGYRNMVAMVADLAWRAVTLNPGLGRRACELIHGTVLIDEIDQHLHPVWQRQVVADLRRTFPGVQFLATTHSPQVVASVKKREVRLLRDGSIGDAGFVEGRDSNSLLEDLFGTPERPRETQAKLDELFRLLDGEVYSEAASLQRQLEIVLGPDDPAMIRARWILDREA
jgi:predicted ATP-binding protein involved in virulence